MLKKIILGLLVLFVLSQLIPVNYTNPPVQEGKDFFQVNQASSEVQATVKASCYDCHSNETQYPWYSKISPVKFMMKNHIDDGRKHLNFSEWADYDS